jgi:hypothetical protein
MGVQGWLGYSIFKMEYPSQPGTAGAFAVCASIAVAKNRKHPSARSARCGHLAEIVP